jgi:hypothetical protein
VKVEQDAYVIWSNEHQQWWLPMDEGFTRWIEAAGRYTQEQAIERSEPSVRGDYNTGYLHLEPKRVRRDVMLLAPECIVTLTTPPAEA